MATDACQDCMSENWSKELSEGLVLRHFKWAIDSNLADQKRQRGEHAEPPERPRDSLHDPARPAEDEAARRAAATGQPSGAGQDHLNPSPSLTDLEYREYSGQDATFLASQEARVANLDQADGGAIGEEDMGDAQMSPPENAAQLGMHQSLERMFQARNKGILEGAITPQAAAAGAQEKASQHGDEMLSELLMAWYYAGYSTGLMMGRQQGHSTE